MVFDCFTFFKELDILEIRLNELDPVVDKFVLVESSYTFQNQPKPFFFEENKGRYEKFLHKIIHIKVEDFPVNYSFETPNSWIIETFQREAISRGLVSAKPEDKIIISDVDEIIRHELISKYSKIDNPTYFFLSPILFFLNLEEVRSIPLRHKVLQFLGPRKQQKYWRKKYFAGPVMKYFSEYTTAQVIRDERESFFKNAVYVPNAGWHFTYQGGTKAIIEKIKSFAHTEFNIEKYTNSDFISYCLKNKINFLDEKSKFKVLEIEDLPEYIGLNRQSFIHLLT